MPRKKKKDEKKERVEPVVEDKNPDYVSEILQNLPQKDLFTRQEAALYLGVHQRTIDNWAVHGLLEKIKKRSTVWVPRVSIVRLVGNVRIFRP